MNATQPELFPASEWCQRWHDRQHSWRHRSEGGFDPSRYDVAAIAEDDAKRFVLEHHYSASYPAAAQRYGIFDHGVLAGVAVLSIPTSRAVLTNVFPELDPYHESLELGRLVLLDEVPANAETWFLARAFHLARTEGVAGIVAFADPVPRVVNGRTLFPGHVGTIYKAKSALYCGRSTPRTQLLLPDGTVLNARSVAKIRQRERGHAHVERRLVALGAHPMQPGERPERWLTDALDAVGARRTRHGGCHRYVFPLHRRVTVTATQFAYPHPEPSTSPGMVAA